MELARQLELHLENEPELYGQKLVILADMQRNPVTAAVAAERFYVWAIEGYESLAEKFDLDPEDIEVSVCREVANTYAKTELKKIEAGAYKELDLMMREALQSALRPGTRVQIRKDGKDGSGKFGIIMEDDLGELLPTEFLTNEDEVAVRLDHDQLASIAINRLDVIEASTMFEPGADLLGTTQVSAAAEFSSAYDLLRALEKELAPIKVLNIQSKWFPEDYEDMTSTNATRIPGDGYRIMLRIDGDSAQVEFGQEDTRHGYLNYMKNEEVAHPAIKEALKKIGLKPRSVKWASGGGMSRDVCYKIKAE